MQRQTLLNTLLHFVELEILDYRLRAKKVKLDVELFGMGDDYLQEWLMGNEGRGRVWYNVLDRGIPALYKYLLASCPLYGD